MMEAKSRLKDLDRIDRNILNELQKDGRISNVELSKRVGLSPTPCLERVRRLERQGYIEGYAAILNPHYLDASLLVFVEITLNRGAPDVFEQFNKAVQVLEEIQSVIWFPVTSTICSRPESATCRLTAVCWGKPCCVCPVSMTPAPMW